MIMTRRFLVIAASAFAVLMFCTNAFAQASEAADLYDRLSDDATASALALSDEQKAAVAEVVTERETALAEAEDDEAKAGIAEAAQTKLGALLTGDQQAQFASLFDAPRIKFNFRFQKWADVLPWLAGEAGLSLVMDQAPEGTFLSLIHI